STSGSVRTGVAIVNSSTGNAQLHLELTRLDGTSAGLSGSLTIPASAQRALFLQEIPGFQSLPMPFKGILRISSETQSDIAVVGLRGRVNERGDFLVTTTPPVDETAAANSKVVFPHIVDGGGYTTQFVTFGGTNGEPPSGNLKLFSQSGGSLNIALQ